MLNGAGRRGDAKDEDQRQLLDVPTVQKYLNLRYQKMHIFCLFFYLISHKATRSGKPSRCRSAIDHTAITVKMLLVWDLNFSAQRNATAAFQSFDTVQGILLSAKK